MKVAYLIDCNRLGGGMEYIRRKMAACPDDISRVFYASRGECSARMLDEWGAERIVVNHLKALVQLLGNPLRKPRGGVVFVVHGIHLRKFDFLPRTLANRMKRFLRLRLERYLYHRCTSLVALTPTDCDAIHRIYGRDLVVTVEPNTNEGLDLSTPTHLKYDPDQFAFVCIARPDFAKGVDVLLTAMGKVQAALRAAGKRLLLIGGARVPSEIADLVEAVGMIPNAGAYMTCGRVLIAPSRWEGMPYLLLEAVARGRRVIASDCPGNCDVLSGYGRATSFPVEDSETLSRLLVMA